MTGSTRVPPKLLVREVAIDLPCANCRYNLRGLKETGRCPECGFAVGPSWARHRYRQVGPWGGRERMVAEVDPRWAARAGAAVVGLGACALGALTVGVIGGSSMVHGGGVILSSCVIIWTVGLACVWRIGAAEPRWASDRGQWGRAFLRLAALIAYASVLAVEVRSLDVMLLPIVMPFFSGGAAWLCVDRVGRWMRRAGRRGMRAEAGALSLLSAISAAAKVWLVPGMVTSRSAGALVFYSAMPMPGTAAAPLDGMCLRYCFQLLRGVGGHDLGLLLLFISMAVLSVWSIVFFVRAGVLLMSVAHEARRTRGR